MLNYIIIAVILFFVFNYIGAKILVKFDPSIYYETDFYNKKRQITSDLEIAYWFHAALSISALLWVLAVPLAIIIGGVALLGFLVNKMIRSMLEKELNNVD